MNFRFTIGKKIGAGFGGLIILTIIVFILTTLTLNKSKRINDEINNIYTPSVEELKTLNLMIVRSKLLIYNWVFIQSGPDNFDKLELDRLIDVHYPNQKEKIQSLAQNWVEEESKSVDTLFLKIDNMFASYKAHVMDQLVSFSDYEDFMIMSFARTELEAGGEIDAQTNEILKDLDAIIALQNEHAESVNTEMLNSFSLLHRVVQNSGILLIIGGILIAFFTIRTIVRPIDKLKNMLLTMSTGVVPEEKMDERSDEIGEMSKAFEKMTDAYSRQVEFSRQVGAGHFEAQYEPLSEQDTLGFVLLKMRDDIKEAEHILEEKVKERTAEVVRQKGELEIINKKVTESINYAKRIQDAILPSVDYIKEFLPQSFRFYKAKDVVSGDFPWFLKKGDDLYIAAVDCTGHGVPGALISIIGYFLLNQIVSVNKDPNPAEILDELHMRVRKTLKQDQEGAETRDGMDIALCKINLKQKTLEHSGAHRPLYMTREGQEELIELKADKAAIGGKYDNKSSFTNNKIDIKKGDTVYFFSDGLVDQFGGPTKRKKFSSRRVREFAVSNAGNDINDIKTNIFRAFNDWMGDTRQLDDVLLIGIKF